MGHPFAGPSSCEPGNRSTDYVGQIVEITEAERTVAERLEQIERQHRRSQCSRDLQLEKISSQKQRLQYAPNAKQGP